MTATPKPSLRLSPRAQAALVAAAAALLYLPLLGAFPLIDVDEGAFSEATREMLTSGDWLSTTLNGQPRFDKPILIYWLQAASVSVFGVHEFAFRLPSALAALAWVYVVGRFAAEQASDPPEAHPLAPGLLAAWIAATSIGVLVIGRAATADALLNLWLACAMADSWRYLVRQERAALRRLYLWVGLGVLTKGPIAVLIPLAVTFLHCAISRNWRRWLRALADPLGWLIFVVVAVPWYVYAFLTHGQAFWDGFFLRHNLQRFGGTLEGHSGSLFYYVLALPLMLLPWTGLLVTALRHLRSDWSEPVRRYLWLWALFVLGFFSLSGTKLPHYVLYGTTPLFVLLAWHARRLTRPRWALLAPTLMLLLLPALPLAVQMIAARMNDPRAGFYVAMLGEASRLAGPPYFAITLGALLLWIVFALRAARRGATHQLAVGAALVAAVSVTALAPWVGELLAGPVKRAGLIARGLPERAVQWNFHVPSFSVYRQRATPAQPPGPGDIAITRIDRLPADLRAEELYRERGVVLLRYPGFAPAR